MYLLVVVALLIAAAVYVAVMGQTEFHRGGLVHRLHLYFQQDLSEIIYHVTVRMFGQSLTNKMVSVNNYLFNEAHPFVQMFYVGLYVGGLVIFFRMAWPLLPGMYLSPWHHQLFIPGIVLGAFGSFLAASFSDPGTIRRDNLASALKHYRYDYLLFHPRVCETCQLLKPARSKHCSLCKRCVAKCDHHCAWLNNCVGHNNYRYFLLFLFLNVVIAGYGAFVIYWLIQSEIDRQPWATMFYRHPETGEKLPIDAATAYLIMMGEYALLVALGVFLAFAGVVVLVFFLYHAKLVWDGVTSNESFKRGDLYPMHLHHGNSTVWGQTADDLALEQHWYTQLGIPPIAASKPVAEVVQDFNVIPKQSFYGGGSMWSKWKAIAMPAKLHSKSRDRKHK